MDGLDGREEDPIQKPNTKNSFISRIERDQKRATTKPEQDVLNWRKQNNQIDPLDFTVENALRINHSIE